MSEYKAPSEFPEPEQTPTASQADTMLASPKLVSPARGFYWLERGLSDVVMPQFKNWFVAGLAYAVIALLLSMLDQRLALVMAILNPIFLGGALLGAHAVYQKRTVPPTQLFKAFAHKNKLFLALYAAINLLLAAVIIYILIQAVGMNTLQAIDPIKFQDPNQQAYQAEVLKTLFPIVKPALLLGLAFFLATWFAPSLILLQDKNPMAAIAQGFWGALKNILAFLVFIIVFIIIMLVVGLLIMLVSSILGAISTTGTQIFINLVLTSIMVPVMAGTAYIGYREVFLGDEGVKKEAL